MLLPLTQKQQVVFEVHCKLYVKNTYPPTQKEVSDILQKASISGEIKALRQKGWLKSIEHLSRRNVLPTDEAMKRFGLKGWVWQERVG